jgi:DNA transformation protein and related proteins
VATNDAIAQLLEEELATMGHVVARRMFGGRGVFIDGLMFALIDDDVFYLKADDATRARFEAENLGPFEYARKDGKRTVMSYWRAPDRVLDEPDELRDWAAIAIAIAAARRAERAKPEPATKAKRSR